MSYRKKSEFIGHRGATPIADPCRATKLDYHAISLWEMLVSYYALTSGLTKTLRRQNRYVTVMLSILRSLSRHKGKSN